MICEGNSYDNPFDQLTDLERLLNNSFLDSIERFFLAKVEIELTNLNNIKSNSNLPVDLHLLVISSDKYDSNTTLAIDKIKPALPYAVDSDLLFVYLNQKTIPTNDDSRSEFKQELHKLTAYPARIFRDQQELILLIKANIIAGVIKKHYSDKSKSILHQTIRIASNGLSSWPHTLPQGIYVRRPELETLWKEIESNSTSSHLLMGGPGSGKSALLAKLSKEAELKDFCILGIKADLLSNEVDSEEKLRVHLGLHFLPNIVIKSLAVDQKILVLIDQLDAVSALLDQQSGRLNVLLNLISEVAGLTNVHVIASTRPLERLYDVRLRTINANLIYLEPLLQTEVEKVLVGAGLAERIVTDALRIPWALDLYLRYNLSDSTSLQALIRQAWERMIDSSESSSECESAIKTLASHIANEEVFWIAKERLLAQNGITSKALNYLIKLGFLIEEQSNKGRVGFRHQSLFTYTLARTFAEGQRSLTDFVLNRQDGLFVRPFLIAGLRYLRELEPTSYHRELRRLVISNPRPHIQTLLIQHIGEQNNPLQVEKELLISFLKSDEDGRRALVAVSNKPTWFKLLHDRNEFLQWMQKPPIEAERTIYVLASAQVSEVALDLIERYWIDDSQYDALTARFLQTLNPLPKRVIELACTIVTRSPTAPVIYAVVKNALPSDAIQVLRADLDRWYYEVDSEVKQRLADKRGTLFKQFVGFLKRVQRAIRLKLSQRGIFSPPETDYSEYLNRPEEPLEKLLTRRLKNWHKLEDLATKEPKVFIDKILPWVKVVLDNTAHSTSGYINEYLNSRALGWFELHEDNSILCGLHTAIEELAVEDTEVFLEFLRMHSNYESLGIQVMLARGLFKIAHSKPKFVLDFLVEDVRRLTLGDHQNCHRYSQSLIEAVMPYLSKDQRAILEEALLNYQFYRRQYPKLTAKEKQHVSWSNRSHRLRLLRAVPKDFRSKQLQMRLLEEERSMPEMQNYDSKFSGVRRIGPRISSEQMMLASDQDLLRLFDVLHDDTGTSDPRNSFDITSGGVVQQSGELKKLTQQQPERVVLILNDLNPQKHSAYAAAVVAGLVNADWSVDEIANIILDLENRGFSSNEYRDNVAATLQKMARKNGLPEQMLNLLESWLPNFPYPTLPDINPPSNDLPSRSILFSMGSHFMVPNGRGYIASAIILGLLQKKPSDTERAFRFLEQQVTNESHPRVWACVLNDALILLNTDRLRLTSILDRIFDRCPEVLIYDYTIFSVMWRGMSFFEPPEMILKWIDCLTKFADPRSKQAAGELLLAHSIYYPNGDAKKRIQQVILHPENQETLLRGIGFAATEAWSNPQGHHFAVELLPSIARHPEKVVWESTFALFEKSRDILRWTNDVKNLIDIIIENNSLLNEIASDLAHHLEPLLKANPEWVAKVCEHILDAENEREGPNYQMYEMAGSLTSIALTLHRMDNLRERGLRIFERLLSMGVNEAHQAQLILDKGGLGVNEKLRQRRTNENKLFKEL